MRYTEGKNVKFETRCSSGIIVIMEGKRNQEYDYLESVKYENNIIFELSFIHEKKTIILYFSRH